ncbi:DUF4159 domain-containing protein [Magnetospira thiophila]
MLSVGALTFAAPWALAALGLVPFLLPLLRLMPPPARDLRFPAIRFLFGLPGSEETAARTPWWLVLLRLLLLLLIIIGAARPLLGLSAPTTAGPLLVVLDDGWAAARDWPTRQRFLSDLLGRLAPAGRSLLLLTTAPETIGGVVPPPRLLTPATARRAVQELRPHPWRTDRSQAAERLQTWLATNEAPADPLWLSDGFGEDDAASLVDLLATLGTLTLHRDAPDRPLLRLLPPQREGDAMRVTARRLSPSGPWTGDVRLLDASGATLDKISLAFDDGADLAQVRLTLPAELSRRLARLELSGPDRTVGGVVLLDDSWRRHPVGLVGFDGGRDNAGVLDPLHYPARALEPTEEVRRGDLAALRERPLALLVMADPPPLSDADLKDLYGWMDRGGTLVRFAGPRLADAPSLPLPVTVRSGDRFLGGNLSWTQPLALAPFPEDSPFAGLTIPAEVKVRRQVLATPESVLAARVWARLEDGTPLVTAEKREAGWLVLVHITADPDWSDLPLSGLFVEMMRRLARLGPGTVPEVQPGESLPALALLDGFGSLIDPPADRPSLTIGAESPVAPGLYGRPQPRAVVNLSWDAPGWRALEPPQQARWAAYQIAPARDLSGAAWTAAALLLLLDLLLSLWARGLVVAGLMVIIVCPVQAAEVSDLANRPRLGHVITGDAALDATARAGLEGLTWMTKRRTAVELDPPAAVDVRTADLSLFPLLYWPLADAPRTLDGETARRVEDYMRRGGLILFDGRGLLARDAGERLRRLTGPLRVPRLMAIPKSHVLGRSFYLLSRYPGRLDGPALWVERPDRRTNDGVATVIVGDNDWAAAWAIDEFLRPLHAVAPGGEQQREMAFRFGINLVMVALTGNYKGDQVHLDAILERLSDDR